MCILATGIFYIKKRILLEKKIYTPCVEIIKDSITTIGIIGDSWAYNSQVYNMDYYIDSLMKTYNHECKVIVYGQKGAKSKDIYLSLINHNLNQINKLDYCIVFSGINDLHGQYGKDFYVHHTTMIIEQLLKYKITPIIIEIPSFNNVSQYSKYPKWKQTCYKILAFYTSGNWSLNNIDIYRKEMENRIKSLLKLNNIIYIKTDSILKGNHSLYSDDMHINLAGNKALYSHIINKLISSKQTQ